MAFEKFIKSKLSKQHFATIWKRGQLGINKAATDTYLLKDYKFVVLYYDEEAQIIGLKFTNDAEEEGAISVIKGKDGVVIATQSFLRYFNISHEITRRYPVIINGSNNFLCVDLFNVIPRK